jgi:thiamine biosynthesis lipoprotein
MSFHDPQSDISRMNREAFPKGVTVHPWTWQVLKSAQEFSRESNGAFDVTIAPLLTNWHYLPPRGYRFDHMAASRDIFLKQDHKVFFRRRIVVDLGGIAKGFAVDRAIDALQETGVRVGIVNAGGDLRVCGTTRFCVHIRHPRRPDRPAGSVLLRDRALATSATYFSRRKRRSAFFSALVNGIDRQPCHEEVSVSVAAKDCLTADALTKIVLSLRAEATPILRRHEADAVLLERDLRPRMLPE